jgi:acyl-CoA thioester hydrolase
VRIEVRVYELDPQRHVAGAVDLRYADQAKSARIQAAGTSVEDLLASGIGPVNHETTVRDRGEPRAGDEVDMSCAWIWRDGKTHRVAHEFRRPDGQAAADVKHVSAALDLETRRLVSDPAGERCRRANPARSSRPRLAERTRSGVSAAGAIRREDLKERTRP